MSSWRSLLLLIGEECAEYGGNTDYRDQLETCFGVVRRELPHSQDDILSFLLQCAEQLPHKIPLYGTLVGLLNLEDEDSVKRILEDTHGNLQAALDSGSCNRIRILMHFLTALMCSKVLQPSSLVVLFETLLSSAATTVDEDKGNPSWQACADFYITCILSCLPWGGAELVEQVPEEIDRVMVKIQAYMSIRRDAGGKDILEDLWSWIQDHSSKAWKLDGVPRPPFEPQLVAGKSHDFGSLNFPELPDPTSITYGKQKHEAELKYPQWIRLLDIFPASKFEVISGGVGGAMPRMAPGSSRKASKEVDLSMDSFFTSSFFCWMIDFPDSILPVRNQNYTSSCYAFAIVDAIHANLFLATRTSFTCSVQECLDFLYQVIPGGEIIPKSGSCHYIADTFDYLVQYGLVEEKDYPFRDAMAVVDWNQRPMGSRRLYLRSYVRIPNKSNNYLWNMITMFDAPVHQRAPFVASLVWEDDNLITWGYEDKIYMGPPVLEKRNKEDFSYHTVLIVGYGVQHECQYFIIKNSHGCNWGHRGYAKIKADLFTGEGFYAPIGAYLEDLHPIS